MQIDVGFGDAVQPEPTTSEFPTVLPQIDPPVVRMYPPEVVIAEKLHAMVVLDIGNSRMKDFYDLWYLARTGRLTWQLFAEPLRPPSIVAAAQFPLRCPSP
jgi:hypothetical protein